MHKMLSIHPRVGGLIFYSRQPARLAGFYRDLLGLELATLTHGPTGPHLEGSLGGIHIAMLDADGSFPEGSLVPVFRTEDIDADEGRLLAQGATRLHPILDIGEGKRVLTFADPDRRPFRLIFLPHTERQGP